ncbi:hypothetical protein VPHD480_0147 [Vibrio phage D480]|nr:hypothetical protein MYOV011v1_p0063 [Vibrio phage 6E35.1a]
MELLSFIFAASFFLGLGIMARLPISLRYKAAKFRTLWDAAPRLSQLGFVIGFVGVIAYYIVFFVVCQWTKFSNSDWNNKR